MRKKRTNHWCQTQGAFGARATLSRREHLDMLQQNIALELQFSVLSSNKSFSCLILSQNIMKRKLLFFPGVTAYQHWFGGRCGICSKTLLVDHICYERVSWMHCVLFLFNSLLHCSHWCAILVNDLLHVRERCRTP
jgi:hypothetical protein